MTAYSGLPDPSKIRQYFYDNYDEEFNDVNFSTNYERVKLGFNPELSIAEAIKIYNTFKQYRLTNLHMTYIEKTQALCIYFELDPKLDKLIKPPDPVSTTIKELF